ncbi:TPA: hypothetical protein ACPZUO_003777 [Yersinia enterocolitica]
MDKKKLEITLANAESQKTILENAYKIAYADYSDEIRKDAERTASSVEQEDRREARLEKYRNSERAAKTALDNQTQVVSDLRTQLHSSH